MTDIEAMDMENQLRRAMRHRLDDLGLTQTALGKQLFPESAKPGSTISQYLRGPRGLLSGTTLKLLEALGAVEINIVWKESEHDRT